jgi:hypothetical protein
MAEEQKNDDQPAAEQPDNAPPEHHLEEHHDRQPVTGSKLDRFKSWYAEHKKWTIPATVLLVILLLAGIPFTRYNLAGLALKRNLTLKVVDSTANTPVSGATVKVGSVSVQTDNSGLATLHNVKVGHHKVVLSKKYYQDKTIDELVPIFSQKNTPSTQLVATGRQVKITVTNLINKKPLADVEIKAAGTTSKTDTTGSAVIVLPAGATDQKAALSADGFNDATVTLKVSNDKIQDNAVNLTPSGKVYFLSKLSGKIDVVKTNLDGTDRKTVLAGTGKEDDQNTVLLASRDWKYLALLSKRAGGNSPSIYLIDTNNDSLSTIDEGSANFSLVGWLDDNFVYSLTRNDHQTWQSGRQALKSFNAQTKKITLLDQTTAAGTSYYDNVTQTLGSVYEYNGQIFYTKGWNRGSSAYNALDNQQATFNTVKPDGTGKKAIRSFAGPTDTSYLLLDAVSESPDKIDLRFYNGNETRYYTFSNGQVKDASGITDENFYGGDYHTYLLSPSGDSTFWSDPRDGKNTLFIGDEDGQSGNQIAALSDYNTYGWFTDKYLLVSKNGSELYIMDASGKQAAVKISDYHKPAVRFNGYGGGYGGF